MRICCYGSLNIDLVFQVPSFVKPKETMAAQGMVRHIGGKGLNQALAVAKAGAPVVLAGNVGSDGAFLLEAARDAGVQVDLVRQTQGTTGIAVIQVEEGGENCILLHGGANHRNDAEYMEKVMAVLEVGDFLVLQNEINGLDDILRSSKHKGLTVFLNPSPYTNLIGTLPLGGVDYLILNEVEGKDLFGDHRPEGILRACKGRYPAMTCILTLGSKGVAFLEGEALCLLPAHPVRAVDTTGAGDAFTGYLVAGLYEKLPLPEAIALGIKAAALTVTRHGASVAQPTRKEVDSFQPPAPEGTPR